VVFPAAAAEEVIIPSDLVHLAVDTAVEVADPLTVGHQEAIGRQAREDPMEDLHIMAAVMVAAMGDHIVGDRQCMAGSESDA
jgi:hypothetical protein